MFLCWETIKHKVELQPTKPAWQGLLNNQDTDSSLCIISIYID